jgi:tetratricopeptide (TPR) repeat protein
MNPLRALLLVSAAAALGSGAGAQEEDQEAGSAGPGASGTSLEMEVAEIGQDAAGDTAPPEAGAPAGEPAEESTGEAAAGANTPPIGEPAITDEDEETPEEKLQRYFALYKDAMENEAYAEADVLAKQVVELTIGLFGVDSLDSARALTNLGIAQHQNGDYESAIANYEAAIDIIERTEDRLNGNLVNPLKGLGAAQLASGRPDLAADTFERAVHITHVNEGPHNLMQVEVLESLAETYLAAGNLKEVETITEIIFGLEARGIPLDSMAIIPVLEKQANWQHRLQLFEKERYTWRKIIDIIEDHEGDDDLRLIAPLTGLGKSYLYVGNVDAAFHHPTSISSGEVYLKRAVRIAEENPEANWETREDTLLALGDFYILSGQPSRARKVYEQVWDLLSANEERLENRRKHLETPVVLQDINPPHYVGIDGEVRTALPGDDYEQGELVFDYTVSTRGYTTDVVLVKAEPAAFEEMQRTVQRDLRSLIYRPRFVDGQAVDTPDLTYTHKFYYRQSDLAEAMKQADVAAASGAPE